MNAIRFGVLIGLLGLFPIQALALSRSIDRDIEFPKNYDTHLAHEIRAVIQDEQFKSVGGIVSYWPPDWGTRLSFEGDANSLNAFLSELRKIKGIALRIVLYHGRDDDGRRDSDWQLDFSHARPKEVAIYLNLRARNIEFEKIKLPVWNSAG